MAPTREDFIKARQDAENHPSTVAAFEAKVTAYATWQATGERVDVPEYRAMLDTDAAYLKARDEAYVLPVGAEPIGPTYIPRSTGSTGGDWFDERG